MKNSFKFFKYFIIALSPKFYHICLARKQCCSNKIVWTTHRVTYIHRSTLDQVFGLVVWLHQSTTWTNMGLSLVTSLTLSQCTLADPVSTVMPLECHWLTQCTLGYHWATQRILAGYTGTPLEKPCWNSPHWNATGETRTFAAYTGRPLEGLWQPTPAPTHLVKHAK